jgi:hypothetical protein
LIDFPAHIAAEEAWTRQLAREPGWRDYITDKVKRMAKWQPAMYGHLPEIVKATPINQPENNDAISA